MFEMFRFTDCYSTIQRRTSNKSCKYAGWEMGHKALSFACRNESAIHAANTSAWPEEVSKRSKGKKINKIGSRVYQLVVTNIKLFGLLSDWFITRYYRPIESHSRHGVVQYYIYLGSCIGVHLGLNRINRTCVHEITIWRSSINLKTNVWLSTASSRRLSVASDLGQPATRTDQQGCYKSSTV